MSSTCRACLVCHKTTCRWAKPQDNKDLTYNQVLHLHRLNNLFCEDTTHHIELFDLKDYTKTNIPTDGNCFFHCFAKFLNNPEVSFESLREQIWQHISERNANNDDEISELKNWCPDFDNDLLKLLTDGQFDFDLFDHIPKIMANLLKINLFIHGPSESSFVHPEWSQTIHVYLENSHFTLLIPASISTRTSHRHSVKPKEKKIPYNTYCLPFNAF
jgi:hypothetical protein